MKEGKYSQPIEALIEKIDSLIISLRYNYFHLYRKQLRKDYKTIKTLADETIKIINSYLNTVKKFTDNEPSYELLFMESKLC